MCADKKWAFVICYSRRRRLVTVNLHSKNPEKLPAPQSWEACGWSVVVLASKGTGQGVGGGPLTLGVCWLALGSVTVGYFNVMFGLLIVYCSKEFLNPSYHGLQLGYGLRDPRQAEEERQQQPHGPQDILDPSLHHTSSHLLPPPPPPFPSPTILKSPSNSFLYCYILEIYRQCFGRTSSCDTSCER
ncbi:hypothetical protein INR49_014804 [Caranx melampygus]|nr:hypothetical protein INR49_014804 [Caranx melampygus]